MINFSQSEHIVTIVSRDECLPLVALPPPRPPVIKAVDQNALLTRQSTIVCRTGSSLTLLCPFFLWNESSRNLKNVTRDPKLSQEIHS